MQPPKFDHSVEMIEAIRAAANRLTREKKVSVNRQAKALTEFAQQLQSGGEKVGVLEISQQVWNNFSRPDSDHLPNNRAILDVAWRWLHAEHEATIIHEVRLRQKPRPHTEPRAHPLHSSLNFHADVMASYARPHFGGDLTGNHTLLLPHAEQGFDYRVLRIDPPELQSRVWFALDRRTYTGQITEHHYDGTIVPHLFGLMVIASGPRGRDPATILLRDAHVKQAPPGYAFCGSMALVQNEDVCVTQPCIFLPYVDCYGLDHAEMSDELRRMLEVTELIRTVLTKAPIII